MRAARATLVDSHAHLDFPEFAGHLDEVIARANATGVGHILTIGISYETALAALDIARKYAGVSAAAGIHPNEVGAHFERFPELVKLFETEPLVAVGETGLDFYRNRTPAEEQKEAFRAHLELALERDLPVIIHVRDAYEEALKALDSLARMPRGVFHCFSGAAEFAREALDRGFFVSFAGQVTYKNAEDLRAVAGAIPVGRLLVETDCPYLSPVPHRGKTNEPSYVLHTAEKLAGLVGVPYDDFARATTANAWRLFGIGEKPAGPTIAYALGDSLYLNITNRCPNSCPWCVRYRSPYLRGHNLALEHEPSHDEIIAAMGDVKAYREVVFCGYGEPTERLDVLKQVAKHLKRSGARVRLDTNGLGSLVAGRDITGELVGLIDAVSVSLNTADARQYSQLCRPEFGQKAHGAVVEFIRGAKASIGDVSVTVVALPDVDIEAARRLAAELGVGFRVRQYIAHG